MIYRALPLAVAIALSISCGKAQTCTPGDSKACVGPGGCQGGQACNSDGQSYSTCNCGGTGGGTAATGGGAAATGGGAAATGGGTAATGGGTAATGGGTAATGGGTTSGSACDPVLQTGCAVGQRCTWLQAGDGGTAGAIKCLADGHIDAGLPCVAPIITQMGPDNCKAGSYCLSTVGLCVPLCASPPLGTCGSGYVCEGTSGEFATDAGFAAGLCNVTCDPLTGKRDLDGAAACGGPNTQSQPLGCYAEPGDPFVCEPAGVASLNANVTATPYVNVCSAGLETLPGPLMNEQLCTPICQPGPTSTTSQANAGGLVGSGKTCSDLGAPTYECRYWDWFEQPPLDSFGRTIGFCLNYTAYQYTDTGNMMVPYPSCKTLSSTAHNFDATLTDTQFWGCEPYP